MLSSYSSKLYTRIQDKNQKNIVTVDSLYENKTYKATEKIANAIRELRSEGLITIKSILDHGKFASEIVTKEGYIEHMAAKGVLRKEETDEEESSEGESLVPLKRKYKKRTVRRSVV
jgi:hypothetical protein